VIRINKPADPPAVLAGRGIKAAQQLRDEYDSDPVAFREGAKRLDIKRSIYANQAVVEALTIAQHRKCCFCERKSLGDVEHYRPKSGYQQSADDPLERPGYYWLAYDWDNLFLACGPCNQRFKRNQFPLEIPQNRARSHHDKVESEAPLLIHPQKDDPQEHIGFREEIAYPIGNSPRGRASIEVLGLNHEEIVESRRNRFALLLGLKKLRNALVQEINQQIETSGTASSALAEQLIKIDELFTQALDMSAEYSSMAKAVLQGDF
jgi:uncharacterized protein (TIGR02646 family)